VKAHNTLKLTLTSIKHRDKLWKEAKPEIDDFIISLRKNPAAVKLFELENSQPYFIELFLMGNQGAIIAATNKTTDYWQGDEDKFIKSFNHGEGSVQVGKVIYDESSEAFIVQISIPIWDKDRAIGSLTAGINLDINIVNRFSVNENKPLQLTGSERAWLDAHPDIHLGFSSDFEPALIVDQSGGLSGIYVDMIDAINQRLGINISIDVGSWPEMVEKARITGIDGLLGSSITGAKVRGHILTHFTNHSKIAIFSRSNANFNIRGWKDITDLRIVHIKQRAVTTQKLKNIGNNNSITTVDNVIEALRLLIEDKADIFIGLSGDNYHISSNMLTGLHIAHLDSESVFYGIAVRDDWPELVTIINKAIKSVGQEKLNSYQAKWINIPSLKPAELLTEEERTWANKHPEIKLAIGLIYKRGSKVDENKEINGFWGDIVATLNQHLSLNMKIIPTPWSEMHESSKKGKTDGIISATDIGAKTRGLHITHAITHSTSAIYARTDAVFTINEWRDINGLRIVYIKGRKKTEDQLRPFFQDSEIIAVETSLKALNLLLENKADVFVGGVFDNYQIIKYSLVGVKLVYMGPEKVAYGIAVRQDWPELVQILNKGINAIGRERINQLKVKWTNVPSQQEIDLLTHKERRWVKAHPEIILGFGSGFEPGVIVDNEGKLSGTWVELIELLNRQLNINMKLEVAPWPEIVEWFKQGSVDALLGTSAAGAKNREQHLTLPIYQLEPAVFTRTDSSIVIDDLKDLTNLKIVMVQKRAWTDKLLKKFGDKNRIIQVKTVPEAFNLLLKNKADAFVGAINDNYHINKHFLSGLNIAYIAPERTDLGIGIRSDWPELQTILNKGLKAIGEKKINAISAKWLNIPSPKKVDLLSKEERKWLEDHPNIRLGFAADIEPWLIINKDGSHAGVIPDISKELERLLGFSISIEIAPWKKTLEKAKRREIDGVFGGALVAHEENELLSTKTFSSIILTAYGRTDSGLIINELEDLRGLRIVYFGVAIEKILTEHTDIADVTVVENAMQGFRMLIERKADLYIGFSFDNYYIIKDQLIGIQAVFVSPEKKIYQSIGIRDDWQPLADILNKGISAIGESSINAIIAKWIRVPEQPKKDVLTNEEKDWLKKLPPLKVAIFNKFAPFEYMGIDGHIAGITTDYIKIISERLGITIEPIQTDHQVRQLLLAGDVDLSFILQAESEYEQSLVYTPAYLDITMVVATKRNKPIIQKLDELNDKTIAVIKNSAAHHFLNINHQSIKLKLVSNMEKTLLAVNKGKAYALFGNAVSISYLQIRMGIDDLRIALSTKYSYQPVITVRKELEPLIPILKKTLSTFSEQEKKLIFDKWVNQPFEKKINWKNITLAGSLIFAIVAAFIIWQDRKIRQSQAKAIAAFESSLKIKNDFLTAISHELRTPMNAIFGGLQIVQSKPLEELPPPLDVVLGGASDMMRLVNDILSYTEVQSNQCRLNADTTDIQILLQQLHEKYAILCHDKNLKLHWHVDTTLPERLELDEEKLQTVLEKLLENAIKYTDHGFVQFDVKYDNKLNVRELVFSIIDSGIGISEDNKLHIFEAFKQKESGFRRNYGGLGIGLSICKKLLEAMEGEIYVQSTPGYGSCFTVKLPVCLGQEPKDKLNRSLAKANLPILIVEDNKVNQQVMQKMLEKIGYQSILANHGQEALELLENRSVSVILMDLQMPVMDGFSCAKEIRHSASFNTIPIIAVTANLMDADKARCTQSGMNDFIKKPVRLDILKNSLSHYIEATKN